MIAADPERSALFNGSIDVKNVVGRAAADVDHERSEIFLMLSQHDLSGRESTENHVFDVERQFLDAADGVLNPRPHPVDDVKVRFQLVAEHSDRIKNSILPVDMIMLNN